MREDIGLLKYPYSENNLISFDNARGSQMANVDRRANMTCQPFMLGPWSVSKYAETYRKRVFILPLSIGLCLPTRKKNLGTLGFSIMRLL